VRHSWRPSLIALSASLFLLTACGSGQEHALSSTPVVSATGGDRPVLRKIMSLDFEQVAVEPLGAGAAIRPATADGPGGEVELAGAGQQPLRLVPGRDNRGHGVAFPAPCPPSPKPTCPKAIIEVANDPALDPGREDYEWGASILLEADQTSDGSNIVQKGFSTGGGSQWKLQVDHVQGHPSCTVVGQGDAKIFAVFADVTVADGTWHDVSCRRAGAELVISVDGAERASTVLPEDLDIVPEGPVRIGGKNLKPNNDQFFGTLDDVYVAAGK
jgi:Concanavalin A-like lectin/glucanases superfamily